MTAITITFDTLQYAKKLRDAGCPEQQAEAQAEALKEVIDNNLATKQDIEDLRIATKQDIENLGIATKQDIENLRADVKNTAYEIERLEYRLLAKFGGMAVVAITILTAIIKL